MFRRALNRVSLKSKGKVGGSIDEEEYDETGVDIVEALDFVNTISDSDASKDFNEKEISISNVECKTAIHETVEKKNLCDIVTQVKPINQQNLNFKQFANDSTNTKKEIISRSKRRINLCIKPKNQDAIKRGKHRFHRQSIDFNYFHNCLPKIVNKKKYQDFEIEIIDEMKTNGNSPKSLSKYFHQDNDCPGKIIFSVKSFTVHDNRWLPSRIECCQGNKIFNISTTYKKSVNFGLKQIDFVKVENNRRILWIKSSKSSNFLLGILLESCQDCEYFMLLLDYCWRQENKNNKNIFINGSLNIELPEKPILYSTLVKWNKFSNKRLEFLGRFIYHLKTPKKEVKSLESANFYIKAGYIYIYELDSESLPFYVFPLVRSETRVSGSGSDMTAVTVTSLSESEADEEVVKKHGTLVIFVNKIEFAHRIQYVISSSNDCKNEEDVSEALTCYRIGISNDQLVWSSYENEIFLLTDNEHCDTNKKMGDSNDLQTVHNNDTKLLMNFKNILLVAVDVKRAIIQIGWAQNGNTNTEECLEVGGSIEFSSESDLFKFLHTFQSCSKIDIIKINSRKNMLT